MVHAHVIGFMTNFVTTLTVVLPLNVAPGLTIPFENERLIGPHLVAIVNAGNTKKGVATEPFVDATVKFPTMDVIGVRLEVGRDPSFVLAFSVLVTDPLNSGCANVATK